MNQVSIVAIDDEPLALRRLDLLLRGIPRANLIGTATNCDDGTALIAERRPDIVLLDIRLRDGSGFDILERLPDDVSPAIIFVTAFDHYAIRAFEISAIDYLLKPIDASRLEDAIERARSRTQADSAVSQLQEMQLVIANLRAEFHDKQQSPFESELWIRGATGSLKRISLDHVDWVGSEDDYVRLHTGETSHLLRLSIRALEAKVDPTQFVRVHRSALVRLDRIVEVHRTSMGRREVLLRDGTRISAGRVYAKQLHRILVKRNGLAGIGEDMRMGAN